MTNVTQIQKALNVPKNVSADSVLNNFKDKKHVIYGTVLNEEEYSWLLINGNRDDLICVDMQQVAFALTGLCKADDADSLTATVRLTDTPNGLILRDQSNADFTLKGVFVADSDDRAGRLCRLFAVI